MYKGFSHFTKKIVAIKKINKKNDNVNNNEEEDENKIKEEFF